MSGSSFKFGNLHLKNAKEVSDYTTKLITDTEKLITNTIPDKIFSLENLNKNEFELLANDLTLVNDNINIQTDGVVTNNADVNNDDGHNHSAKKRKFDADEGHNLKQPSIPCNKKLVKLIDLMKPEIKDMIETCAKIQMWIQLLIPRIEDGNNFGVSIQEEVLNEINRILGESVNYLDAISRYFVTRAKLISKCYKYPYIEDYRRGVKEVDDKEFLSLKFSIQEIKNHYLAILDVLSKNYEKIKKPRSVNNLESMY